MSFKLPMFPRRDSYRLAFAMLLGLSSTAALCAQSKQSPDAGDTTAVKAFRLDSGTSFHHSNDVLNGVRVLEPKARVYDVPDENKILISGTPEQIELAGRLIAEMDHSRRNYRLTYTVTEMDGGKRTGVQHYTLLMFPGWRATLKQGSKVPVVTGSVSASPGSPETSQITYLDIGITVDATLDEAADGMKLLSKIQDSGVADDKTLAGVSQPIIRQTNLEGTSLLQPGQPLSLGSLDVPGSTRHLEVEVLLDAVGASAH